MSGPRDWPAAVLKPVARHHSCNRPFGGPDQTQRKMQIFKEFSFEAAHYLPTAEPGTPNARIHGHSFRVRVVVEGQPADDTGYIFHFDELSNALAETQDALDHRLLNEIEGLSKPTLECIAIWIWDRVANTVPGLAEVHVLRPSCSEGCVYRGSRT